MTARTIAMGLAVAALVLGPLAGCSGETRTGPPSGSTQTPPAGSSATQSSTGEVDPGVAGPYQMQSGEYSLPDVRLPGTP